MPGIKLFETMPDAEIINKIQAGDIQLFEVLIRRNNPFLYKVGISYGYNQQEVEDLMQETFIAAYLNLGKFESRSSFKTWIIRIMLNQCYQKSQKMSYKNEKTSDISSDHTTTRLFESKRSANVHDIVLNKEVNRIIGNALLSIPIEYRMVFSLRELNGLSTAETAKTLHISETNVKVRLNRAKHMLRDIVEKIYTPEDIFEFNLIYCDRIVDRVMTAIKNL